jgi:hypothetical protein
MCLRLSEWIWSDSCLAVIDQVLSKASVADLEFSFLKAQDLIAVCILLAYAAVGATVLLVSLDFELK